MVGIASINRYSLTLTFLNVETQKLPFISLYFLHYLGEGL